jgi:Fe-S-cluster containining protein
MKTSMTLAEQAVRISSKLVNCRGCTICCEQGGLVYVLDKEADSLSSLGVPLLTLDGARFIQRLQDGSCPMLDRKRRKCSIYSDRPLCCRLYPLDALSTDGRLHWAVATLCPKDRRHFETRQGPKARIGSGAIARIASYLDAFLEDEDVVYLERKERVLSGAELLDEDKNGWIVLGEV